MHVQLRINLSFCTLSEDYTYYPCIKAIYQCFRIFVNYYPSITYIVSMIKAIQRNSDNTKCTLKMPYMQVFTFISKHYID